MRIAFVYDAVYPEITGGVERRVWELARRLAARGHEVHLFGMHLWKGERTVVREGVYLHGICRPYRLYRKGKRRFFPSLMFGVETFFALAKERFDIVDCQQFPYLSAFSAALSCRISGSPLIITWHEVWGDYWYEYLGISGAAGKWIERVIAKIPAYTIAVSDTTADGLARISGGSEISIVPNGISSIEIDAVQPSGEESDLVFVGRLIPEKHVDILIDAVSLLNNHFPEIRCLIIGDGPERRNLEMKVRASGLGNHVVFTGKLPHSNDVISSMKSSRVFVFPSTREGFGISVLEALACGLPVVTIDHPKNASRVFAGNGCGVLSALDAADLSQKIRAILEGEGIGGLPCRLKAHQYEWEAITDMVEDYYRRVHEAELFRKG
ncbi:MAG: glycosyltransferase family 4 protein [Methanoregulaceae archaeon]|nr:glycosyltransferase family 4 protein [Methanoregulaceae archaeon]